MPAPEINQGHRMIREFGFDSLLVFEGFLLVLERTVEEALFRSMVRRHDAPPEMIAVTNGAALKWRMLDGLHKGRGQPHPKAWLAREAAPEPVGD